MDKMEVLKNPNFVPNCSINPIISCGSVMKTAQATVFGFDNTLLGLAGFAALMTVGFSILAGARYQKWFWQLINMTAFLGMIFVHWLFAEAVFRIGSVCPWCMTVWAVVIPPFWYTLIYNLNQEIISTPKPLIPIVRSIKNYKHVILLLWYTVIAGTILLHFWSYFKTVL